MRNLILGIVFLGSGCTSCPAVTLNRYEPTTTVQELKTIVLRWGGIQFENGKGLFNMEAVKAFTSVVNQYIADDSQRAELLRA